MLIGHRTEHDDEHRNGNSHEHDAAFEHDAQREFPFPILEEPSWLEDDALEEMEAPRDNALRGIWIGIAAAAATFILVFAVPHFLGWYDIGPAPQQVKRETAAESVIDAVTAKPSVIASAPAASAPPAGAQASAPIALPPAPPAAQKDTGAKNTSARDASTKNASAKDASPGAPRQTPAAATASKPRTFSVQIAAFRDAKQAGRLAERVKKSGYPADVRHMESANTPWAVRVGTYPTRDQAESARAALARKGFPGFIL